MNIIVRSGGYVDASPVRALANVLTWITLHVIRIGTRVTSIIRRSNVRSGRHARITRTSWVELVAHYAVALFVWTTTSGDDDSAPLAVALFVWTTTSGDDDSALGRVPRVIASTCGLIGVGVLLGVNVA